MFQGNSDRYQVTTNRLLKPIRTRYVRVHPKLYYRYVAMRVELYGCRLGKICNQPLGMRSGRIPKKHITASSQWNTVLTPGKARLYLKKGTWVPKFQNRYQWLQVIILNVVWQWLTVVWHGCFETVTDVCRWLYWCECYVTMLWSLCDMVVVWQSSETVTNDCR